MSNNNFTLAIDFDGVIHDYSKGWDKGKLHNPVPMAKESLEILMDLGFEIILHTARINPQNGPDASKNLKDMKNWLRENGFQLGKHYNQITYKKPIAFLYIDDNALRFTDWNNILTLIAELIKQEG